MGGRPVLFSPAGRFVIIQRLFLEGVRLTSGRWSYTGWAFFWYNASVERGAFGVP